MQIGIIYFTNIAIIRRKNIPKIFFFTINAANAKNLLFTKKTTLIDSFIYNYCHAGK